MWKTTLNCKNLFNVTSKILGSYLEVFYCTTCKWILFHPKCDISYRVPLKSKLPHLVSRLAKRDCRLRDKSIASQDEILVSRDECLVLRDPVKRTFWNKLQAISLWEKRVISRDAVKFTPQEHSVFRAAVLRPASREPTPT